MWRVVFVMYRNYKW